MTIVTSASIFSGVQEAPVDIMIAATAYPASFKDINQL